MINIIYMHSELIPVSFFTSTLLAMVVDTVSSQLKEDGGDFKFLRTSGIKNEQAAADLVGYVPPISWLDHVIT